MTKLNLSDRACNINLPIEKSLASGVALGEEKGMNKFKHVRKLVVQSERLDAFSVRPVLAEGRMEICKALTL